MIIVQKHVAVVFGTRPEAIKLSPLIRELRQVKSICLTVISTDQHQEMLDSALKVFDIDPDIRLKLMTPSQSMAKFLADAINELDKIFRTRAYDMVIVQGDTMSALAACQAAYLNNTPISHVEAGLRTYNFKAPFPEEMNRVMISKMATYHFAATEHARHNLWNEKIPPENIIITGNTVIDALLWVSDQLKSGKVSPASFHKSSKKVILVTAHRRENIAAGIGEVCEALCQLSKKRADIDIIVSMHLNPDVRRIIYNKIGDVPGIFLIEPLDYVSFINQMMHADLIITDSGGIQEEACALGKQVLVTRYTTERSEAVSAGIAHLVGTNSEQILAKAEEILNKTAHIITTNPYGDGTASKQIVKFLKKVL